MLPPPPIVLTIAGFDPSSGAGATADLKTVAAHHCYGIACITALTVQSTSSVRSIEPVPGSIIEVTLEELSRDFAIAAVRIGMLGTAAAVLAAANFLKTHQLSNVVLDPVLRSSSGAELLEIDGMKLLVSELLPLCDVVTPNIEEAAVLTGLPVTDAEGMRAAAERLHRLGARNVVITGGHLSPAADLLSIQTSGGLSQHTYSSEQLSSSSTHGTGCAFATALACRLATGSSLQDAVQAAKTYVFEAIRNAYPIGTGRGPIHHLYRFAEEPR